LIVYIPNNNEYILVSTIDKDEIIKEDNIDNDLNILENNQTNIVINGHF